MTNHLKESLTQYAIFTILRKNVAFARLVELQRYSAPFNIFLTGHSTCMFKKKN